MPTKRIMRRLRLKHHISDPASERSLDVGSILSSKAIEQTLTLLHE